MEPLAALETAVKAKEAISILNELRLWVGKQIYPRPKKDRTGILIAIATEDLPNRQKVQNDFVRTLEELLSASKAKKPFQIIELPWYHLDKIKTIEDAKKVILKCK